MSCRPLRLPSPAVRDLHDFLLIRWLHVGGTGGFDGIEAAGGPDADTLRTLCKNPGMAPKRRTDTRDKLAILLRFKNWEALDLAWHKDDVLGNIGVVLSPGAYGAAKQAATAKKMKLDDWVSRAVVRQAEEESKGGGK